MKIIKTKISLSEFKKMAKARFGDLVKAVVDLEKEIMVVDADLHADQETLLLENGSKQKDLWGINLYPEKYPKNWLEFDSMINLKPSFGNKTRGVDDLKIRKEIVNLVNKLTKK